MTTETLPYSSERDKTSELLAANVRVYLEIKSAYDECHSEIKKAIDDMIAICSDKNATDDEKSRAQWTIVEALFPSLSLDFLGRVDGCRKTPEAVARNAEMQKEEDEFAANVESFMKSKKMTQEDLAKSSGVGQSAISNMLSRRCRPQRRTVKRIAEALGVNPSDLWRDFLSE